MNINRDNKQEKCILFSSHFITEKSYLFYTWYCTVTAWFHFLNWVVLMTLSNLMVKKNLEFCQDLEIDNESFAYETGALFVGIHFVDHGVGAVASDDVTKGFTSWCAILVSLFHVVVELLARKVSSHHTTFDFVLNKYKVKVFCTRKLKDNLQQLHDDQSIDQLHRVSSRHGFHLHDGQSWQLKLRLMRHGGCQIAFQNIR